MSNQIIPPIGGLFEQPPTDFRITELWAFIAIDPKDGNEGVPTVQIGGLVMPLIAADEARLRDLREIAQIFCNQSGVPLTLAKFSVRTNVETFAPKPQPELNTPPHPHNHQD